MKFVKYICASLAMISCFSSCLDVTPQDEYVQESFYKNETNTYMGLMGVYASLASNSLYADLMLGRMGLSADIGYMDYLSNSDQGVASYAVTPQDESVTKYWRDCYVGIGNANNFLEHIDEVAKIDSLTRRTYKAEVRFLRAYYYFMLTKRFGDVPLITSTPRSCSLTELQVSRTPQKDVYDFIIKEMKASADSVVSASILPGGGRISQSAVYGIMARVALNMAGYPVYDKDKYALARDCAKKVIDSGIHELNPDYTQVFKNYMKDLYDIKESIWEVEFYGNNTGSYSTTAGKVGRNNGIRVTTSSKLVDVVGYSAGFVRSNPVYFEMFELLDSVRLLDDGTNERKWYYSLDTRLDWTIARYQYKDIKVNNVITSSEMRQEESNNKHWDNFSGKFRREEEILYPKSVSYTPTNLPLLRYSDVLLMYAEALHMSGGSDDEAYEYMNKVRRRAYGKSIDTPDADVDFPNGTKSNFMDYLMDERARELGHEFLRKDDLTRWNVFLRNMKLVYDRALDDDISRYSSNYYHAALGYYNNVSSRDELWPIPSHDISVNRKLTQNPGW